ncbi:MAG: hypothetical protein SO253_03240 [Bacilli bacterium]|nr:hypothetical protein [Bacilli bacterium]
MILKKVINNDGKVSYEEISYEKAKKLENDEELHELVFTSEDEKADFFDSLEDEDDKLVDEQKEDNFNFGNIFNSFKQGFNFFGKEGKNIVGAFPFMDEQDLYQIAISVIEDDPKYKQVKLVTIMPFLDDSHCDQVLLKLLENKNKYNEINSIIPFVSEDGLSKFVDEYVSGNYQDINMDAIYPFLKSEDVKKVFNYIISKE